MNGHSIWRVAIVLCIAMMCLESPAAARRQLACDTCGTPHGTAYYAVKSPVGQTTTVCGSCLLLQPRCTTCRLPVQAERTRRLDDGRVLCLEDFAAGVFAKETLEEIVEETRREMIRTFWKTMTFPHTNVTFHLLPADKLHGKLGSSHYNPALSTVWGLTETIAYRGKETVFRHQISLLMGLPRSRLMAVCAHEIAHTWLNENLDSKRRKELDENTIEGFCELIAYQLMDALGQHYEKAVIAANLYTRGQAAILVEAERQQNLYSIVEWFKKGVDSTLSVDQLEKIRLLRPAEAPKPSPVAASPPVQKPAPDRLVLKGILQSKRRPLALINDASLTLGEQASIRIGNAELKVKCMEVRSDSVLIQINGAETMELFLRKD